LASGAARARPGCAAGLVQCRPANAHEEASVTSAESAFLLGLAGLSLSFVGFSSVVVTLRGSLGGEISERHLRLVRLYIEGGFLVTALALLPLLLDLLDLPAPLVWRVSSAAAASVFSVLMLTQFRRRRAVEAGRFPPWVVAINVLSVLTVAGLWLNAAGTPLRPGVGPYAVALTWAIGVFGFIFVRTIDIFLHRPGG
jgi:hypothetical protein